MDVSNDKDRITYVSAGFNAFFNRSISSRGKSPSTLASMKGGSQELNFDNLSVSGSIGDVLQVGLARVNGKEGRFEIVTEQDEVSAYFGNRRES